MRKVLQGRESTVKGGGTLFSISNLMLKDRKGSRLNKIVLRDLAESRELDRQAMVAIMGSGIWGTVKKYSRKAGRYGKKRVLSKYREYERMYNSVRRSSRILYRYTRSWF